MYHDMYISVFFISINSTHTHTHTHTMDGSIISPFTMGVFGSRLSGKTYFVSNLLDSTLIQPPTARVIWLYKTWQPLYDQVLSKHKVEFTTTLPDETTSDALIILDDLMSEVANSTRVEELFTGGRHRKISAIYLAQNLFYGGKCSRTLTLNMDYMVLFKNNRDPSQITTLARQMYPTKKDYLMWAYTDATSRPYGHLLIDAKPNREEKLQLRGNIFGSEDIPYQTIYSPTEKL